MTSSEEAEDETLKEIDLQLFYEFDFSQRSWALYRGPINHSYYELSKIKLDVTKFRNAEMANKIKFALEKRMTGFNFENMLWNRVSEDFF
jgi:hypothetical protein